MIEIEPLINGREYGWADIVVNIGGVPITGIRAVKYSQEMEKQDLYGAGRYPVARGYGRVKTQASITLLAGQVMALQNQAPEGQIFRIKPFNIVVSYQPEAGAMVTHILKNCEFLKSEIDFKEGDAFKEIELPLIVSHIQNKSV